MRHENAEADYHAEPNHPVLHSYRFQSLATAASTQSPGATALSCRNLLHAAPWIKLFYSCMRCCAVAPTSFGPYTALRFSGFFYAPYTAQYDFHAHGADGAIVWMDDQRTPFIAGNRAPQTGLLHTQTRPCCSDCIHATVLPYYMCPAAYLWASACMQL